MPVSRGVAFCPCVWYGGRGGGARFLCRAGRFGPFTSAAARVDGVGASFRTASRIRQSAVMGVDRGRRARSRRCAGVPRRRAVPPLASVGAIVSSVATAGAGLAQSDGPRDHGRGVRLDVGGVDGGAGGIVAGTGAVPRRSVLPRGRRPRAVRRRGRKRRPVAVAADPAAGAVAGAGGGRAARARAGRGGGAGYRLRPASRPGGQSGHGRRLRLRQQCDSRRRR